MKVDNVDCDALLFPEDDVVIAAAPIVGATLADDRVDAFIVTGIPHIFDSVILTTLSFGLLGLQIAAFSCGAINAALT
jgi:hypothetical protein